MYKNTKGFTLIEISIVIVIIGLIISSIVAGSSLVNSSKQKVLISEIIKHKESINLFKDRFLYYPGDFNQAYNFWNTDCASSRSLCDGNGDWKIDPDKTEGLLVWRHLFLADLVDKTYTGTSGLSTKFKLNDNIPTTKFTNNGLFFLRTYSFPIFGVNGLSLSLSSANDQDIRSSLISPKDAKAIDNKFDDGMADSGNLVVMPAEKNISDTSLCVNSQVNTSSTGEYILSDNQNSCQLIYWISKE